VRKGHTDGAVADAGGRTWRSTSIMGPCSDLSYTVTRDAPLSTPRVSYTATCTAFNGGGSSPATVVGTTLAWSTGSTTAPCGIIQLNFTARLVSPSSSEVTYAGTFCDALVAGTATMQRST
jgi:hypothetical protein